PRRPVSPLFPYATLFRSRECLGPAGRHGRGVAPVFARESLETGRAQAGPLDRGVGRLDEEGVMAPAHRPQQAGRDPPAAGAVLGDRKSTRLNSSHVKISY